jgi:hypothetical protein
MPDFVIVDPTTVRGFVALVRSRGIVAAIFATVREVRA